MNGTVPDKWQEGIICPIYKNGDKMDTNNYRGITLQNVTCKIYGDILNTRLMKWIEINHKLCEEQNGFRSNRSCEDHIYALNSIVNMSLAEGKQVYSCFADFSKAFDRVDRNSMWYKLLKFGIKGRMYFAIKSLYANVKCSVKLSENVFTFPSPLA